MGRAFPLYVVCMCLDISQQDKNEDCKCDSPRGYHPLKTSGNSPSRFEHHMPKYWQFRPEAHLQFASVSTKQGAPSFRAVCERVGHHKAQSALVILMLNEMSGEICFSRHPPLNSEKQYNHRGIDTMRLLKSLPALVACLFFSSISFAQTPSAPI